MSSYESSYSYEAPQFPPLGSISVWFGVIVVAVTAVTQATAQTTNQHDIWASPFLQALQLMLITLLLGSTLFLLIGGSKSRAQALLPLFINIGVLLIIRFVPFGTIWHDVRFQVRLDRYQSVAQLIEVEQSGDGWLTLPDQYAHLSAHQGQVFVTTLANGHKQIIFPTTAVANGKMTGYVYRADDQPPQSNLFTWRYVVAKQPYWFFCSSL